MGVFAAFRFKPPGCGRDLRGEQSLADGLRITSRRHDEASERAYGTV